MGAVADRLGRHWVGIDSNEAYVDMALDRIADQREA